MFRLRTLALALALAMLPWAARADDGKKPDEKKADKPAKEQKSKKEKSERGGSGFVNFWVHTVGGTIGNGLKSGARKIEKTFD